MSLFSDSSWLAWLGLALVLAAVEAASVDFVFSMLAGGALAGAVAAALGASLTVQVIAAVVVAAASLSFSSSTAYGSGALTVVLTGAAGSSIHSPSRTFGCQP